MIARKRRVSRKISPKFLIAIGILVVVLFAVPITMDLIKRGEEEKRDYWIDVVESVDFDCKLEKKENNHFVCREQKITGKFSEYPLTTVRDAIVNGQEFSVSAPEMSISEQELGEGYDAKKYSAGIEKTLQINLRNDYLNKDVASREVKVKYKFGRNDIAMLDNVHAAWQKEQKRIADEKAKKEAEKKAKEIEESKKKSEEARKKIQERKNKKVTDISEGEVRGLCEYGYSNSGYKEAKITVVKKETNDKTYTLYGKMTFLDEKTRRDAGSVKCEIDWRNWKIKSLSVRGMKIF